MWLIGRELPVVCSLRRYSFVGRSPLITGLLRAFAEERSAPEVADLLDSMMLRPITSHAVWTGRSLLLPTNRALIAGESLRAGFWPTVSRLIREIFTHYVPGSLTRKIVGTDPIRRSLDHSLAMPPIVRRRRAGSGVPARRTARESDRADA